MSDLHIRIAWYDREFDHYAYGAWRSLETTDVPEYIAWAQKQNAMYPLARYWVEVGEKECESKGRNIESHKLIRLEYESPTPTPIDTYVVIDISGDDI